MKNLFCPLKKKEFLQFIKKEIDKDSIFQYFFFKNIFHEKTFFKMLKIYHQVQN